MEPSRSLLHMRGQLAALIRQRLWLQVLIGMVLGVAFGLAIGPTAGLVEPRTSDLIGNWVALPGRLFLLGIQFVVVPLVVASVIRGIAAGEGSDNLGRLGARTIGFFVAATVIAAMIGLGLAIVIQPGSFIDGESFSRLAASSGAAIPEPSAAAVPGLVDLPELLVGLFPRDPLASFLSGNMLQIVITATIIGVALIKVPADQRRLLLDLMAAIQAACMAIVGWVLRFAPLAVFGLLAHISAKVGPSALLGTGAYVMTVVTGLFVLMVVYVAIARAVSQRSTVDFLRISREALLLAFSTSSSAAVMPVSLRTAEQGLGVRSAIARFVIPLGTTVNMSGTALYQGVATLFLAQAFGVELGVPGMVLVVVMATGAAIGSPGTPGVGIVILATILSSVGIPAAGIAILLGVDRLLDMCRTVVNVAGDLVACLVMERWMGGHKAMLDAHVPTPAMSAPPPEHP